MLAASATNLSRFILLLPTPAWKLSWCHHGVAFTAWLVIVVAKLMDVRKLFKITVES